MTTADYWQRLPPFDHVVTYSFNRGPRLEQLLQAAEQEMQELRRQLLTSTGARLQQLRAAIRRCEAIGAEQDRLLLTTGPATFNSTATPIAQPAAATVAEIGALLRRPVVQRFDWMCAPVYRDALAFCTADGRLLSVLNICFQCDQLMTDVGQQVQADASVYRALKTLLQGLGHPIPDGYEGLPKRQ